MSVSIDSAKVPGFWGDSYSTLGTGLPPALNYVRHVLAPRVGLLGLRELFDELLGEAAGSAAAASYLRSDHEKLGGAIDLETVYEINRNTTATDVTNLKAALFTYTGAPSSYPTNAADAY